ncbi:uncharacterized protein LOC117324350 [Pecten maximus]|uniref:uncharacterized protein LOC117324350 n=1 Tax=Pecten maximus TaxID=6579 RepID=UPI001458B469|nr:uncharacterized protein LOC117324350 [Pecten maximus]XP_033736053.1 uncharacterized protein LOC117324350 [Pecten maximus]
MSDEGQNMQFPNLSIREGCWKCDGVLTDLTRLPNGLLVCERCHDELIGYKSRKNEILRANRKETLGRVRDVDIHNKEVAGRIADVIKKNNGEENLPDTFRPDPDSSNLRRPVTDMNVASGFPRFVEHGRLETSTYLQDDTIYLKIKIGLFEKEEEEEDQ